MAMNMGAHGSDEPELMLEINTTPLIDVMLVLLVMLIITIPVQLHSVPLAMPLGGPTRQQVQPEKIQIDIGAGSVVHWQGLPVSAAELEARLAAAARLQPPAELHIRPDKTCSYAVFVAVLASSRRLGLSKVAVIGSEQFVQ